MICYDFQSAGWTQRSQTVTETQRTPTSLTLVSTAELDKDDPRADQRRG